jgi:hypothetical protein
MDNVQKVHNWTGLFYVLLWLIVYKSSVQIRKLRLLWFMLHFSSSCIHSYVDCMFLWSVTLGLFVLLVCVLGFGHAAYLLFLFWYNETWIYIPLVSTCFYQSHRNFHMRKAYFPGIQVCAFYKISQICLKTEHTFCNFKYLEMRNIRNQKYKIWVSLYIFFHFIQNLCIYSFFDVSPC